MRPIDRFALASRASGPNASTGCRSGGHGAGSAAPRSPGRAAVEPRATRRSRPPRRGPCARPGRRGPGTRPGRRPSGRRSPAGGGRRTSVRPPAERTRTRTARRTGSARRTPGDDRGATGPGGRPSRASSSAHASTRLPGFARRRRAAAASRFSPPPAARRGWAHPATFRPAHNTPSGGRFFRAVRRAARWSSVRRGRPRFSDHGRRLGRGAGLVGPEEEPDEVPPGLLDRVPTGPVRAPRLPGGAVPPHRESSHGIPSHEWSHSW